jgi:hypothetical protein
MPTWFLYFSTLHVGTLAAKEGDQFLEMANICCSIHLCGGLCGFLCDLPGRFNTGILETLPKILGID